MADTTNQYDSHIYKSIEYCHTENTEKKKKSYDMHSIDMH